MSIIQNILFTLFSPKTTRVISNERLSSHFQFLTIKGIQLKNSEWIPGQKIKVKLSNEEKRSYTPTSWDSKSGVMQTLVYMHGKGPGALWARDAKVQDKVDISMPVSPLSISPETKTILFFGDETTFGLAYAINTHMPNIHFNFFFEANDVHESSLILKKFSLENSTLVGLNKLDQLAPEILKQFRDNQKVNIILSGKQQSIIELREKLYQLNIPKEQIGIKVYWGWKDDPNGKLKK